MAATGTATSTEKGRRIVGAERQTLAKDLVKRYTGGESIRALAASTGRSYGFIHRVLTENSQSMFSCLCVELSKSLLEILINSQRTLFARQIFDAGDDLSRSVKQIDALHAVDGRQLLKIFLE